ncbi:MAG: hypothetical protein ACKVJU_13125 [Verrucomicrobiales bacterium]
MEEPTIEEEIIPEYGHRMSTWPVFWGVIAIIFGVVGALVSGYGAMQSAAMTLMPMDEILEVQMAESAPSNGGNDGFNGDNDSAFSGGRHCLNDCCNPFDRWWNHVVQSKAGCFAGLADVGGFENCYRPVWCMDRL